ncbi:MutS protein 1, partial [Dimargaris cristalligena]
AILAKCLENMGRSLDAFVVSTRPLARFQVPLSEEDSDPFFSSPVPSNLGADASIADPLGRPPGQFLDFIRAQNLSDTELRASRGLMRYVIETQAGKVPHLQTATHLNAAQTMKIDSFTFRSLEILESMTASSTTSRATGGNLIHIIDHTQTKAGSRMLSEYLRAPLTSIPELNERLDLVQLFFDSPDLLHRTRTILRDARDAQRAVQKLSLGYGGPADLLDIASALEAVTQIRELGLGHLNRLTQTSGYSPDKTIIGGDTAGSNRENIRPSTEAPHRLFKGIVSLDGLVQVIRNHIHPDAPRRVNGRGFIQGSSSSALNRLHNDLAKLESDLGKLELLLRTRFSSNSLKLIMQTGSRSYIEVSPRDAKSIVTDPEFEVFQTLRGKHRFLYKPWMLLAEYIQATNEAIFQEEMALYQSVLGQVLHQSQRVVGNCRSLAQIDVAASCAHLARDFGYTRPVFRTDQPGLFRIQDGRHPVVENNLRRKSRHFISNDCHLDSERPTALLTGPNMGGKSTFLRQNAIIAILAQIGSFVPARLAELSIIDRVFSRVGASDNLAENQSTFMVEMAETAHILTHATSQSLVIVDEVGRGTSTVDGLAIAYATLVRLARDIGCRSLVATHYHELTDLAGISPMLATAEPLLPPPSVTSRAAQSTPSAPTPSGEHHHPELPELPTLPNIQFLNTSIYTDPQGHFSFVHKVLPGVSRESHGIQVAQLAGFPEEALKIARALVKLQLQQQQLQPPIGSASSQPDIPRFNPLSLQQPSISALPSYPRPPLSPSIPLPILSSPMISTTPVFGSVCLDPQPPKSAEEIKKLAQYCALTKLIQSIDPNQLTARQAMNVIFDAKDLLQSS